MENIKNIAIGQQIAVLLNLKFNKQGQTATNNGKKTIQGLGAAIMQIIEEQSERLT